MTSVLQCNVHLWNLQKGKNRPLTAEELVDLSQSEQKFSLGFSSSPYKWNTKLEIEFHENSDLLSDKLKEKFKTLSNNNFSCNYEGISNGGEHNALSLCSVDEITGVIHLSNDIFVLSKSGSNFVLIPQGGSSCDWERKIRKRRAIDADSNLPDYYKDYIDGIRRFVELVFIADHTIYEKYEKDEKKIHDRLHSIASVANSLYAPLNIRITLVWADIWKKDDIIPITAESDKMLNAFLDWRKNILESHPHDNAHLITDTRFGQVIGKAFKGTMCSFDYSGGVIVDHSENAAFVGGTVAHEMGHNFGMEHDAGYPDPCKCSAESCIMAPSSSNVNSTTYFSDCSLEFLDHALKRGVDYCLHNVPKAAFGGAKCGNAILEPGEECDCGSTVSCPNKCCIASECKLAEHAECADGECCDTKTCKPKQLASKCREATNSCDLPEYCDGKNPSCPPDFFVQNGLHCPDAPEDYCYEGQCGSRDQQCQMIWGPTGKNSAPECYAFNTIGSLSGNCGYDRDSNQYSRCRPENTACGRLQCQHMAEKPMFGDPSAIHTAYGFVRLVSGQEAACRVIRTSYTGGKSKLDPGMVPDGAVCGPNKICINAECKNRTEVIKMVSKCEPENCNFKGICNNVGNCHCQNSYGGVACDIPGYGGIVNSGPASDNMFNPGLVLLYLLLIGIIAFCIATYYCKRKKQFWLHKKVWKYVREKLDLYAVRVPIRRAPPPPGTQIHHTHRMSFNSAWGEPQGEVIECTAVPSSMVPAKITARIIENPSSVRANMQNPATEWKPPVIKKEAVISNPVINIAHRPPAIIQQSRASHEKEITKQEKQALKAESSSDEQLYQPKKATKPVPPPPPPHKPFKPKQNVDPIPPSSAKSFKPKVPNKPPVTLPKSNKKPSDIAAQNSALKTKVEEFNNTNSSNADDSKRVNVKLMAAKFDTKSNV